jgi:hypothetical protein
MVNRFDIELSATDIASPVMDRLVQNTQRQIGILDAYGRSVGGVNQELDRNNKTSQQSADRANALDRQWNKLTSNTEFLASGVKRFGNLLSGLVWGTAIGAAASLTDHLIKLGIEAFNQEQKFTRLAKAVAEADEAYRNFGQNRVLELRGRLQELSETMASIEEQQRRGVFVPPENIARIREEYAQLKRELEGVGSALARPQLDLGRFNANLIANAQFAQALRDKENTNLIANAQFQERVRNESNAREAANLQANADFAQAMRDRENANLIANAQFEQQLRDERNQREIENAQFQARIAEEELARKIQAQQNYMATFSTLANALYALSNNKSRALFALSKAVDFAMAINKAHVAYAMALASPPGPPFTIGLAESVRAMGYANAALIAASAIGALSGGFGGGGSAIGSPTNPAVTSPVRSSPSQQGAQWTIIINHTGIMDKNTITAVTNELLPEIGNRIKESGGVAGDIIIEHKRP